MNRRGFIAGLLAAPALVRVSSLDLLPKGVILGRGSPHVDFFSTIMITFDEPEIWGAGNFSIMECATGKVIGTGGYRDEGGNVLIAAVQEMLPGREYVARWQA